MIDIQRISNRKKGAVLMMASAFFFAIMQIPINLTADTIPLMEQIFARNIVCVVVCIWSIRKQGEAYFGAPEYRRLLLIRSLFGLAGLITMFYAVAHAIQADVSIITKLSPFMITILAAIFLKEKIQKVQIIALIVAFAGAIFVANPSFNSNLFPLFMAFLCAVFSSGSYTLLAYFKNKVGGMSVILYFSLFCVIVSIPFMMVSPNDVGALMGYSGSNLTTFVVSLFGFKSPTLFEGVMLSLIGLTGVLGQVTLTYAYRMAPAGEISVYNYSNIIFATILGSVFLHEEIQWNSVVGGVFVIIAAVIVYRHSKNK